MQLKFIYFSLFLILLTCCVDNNKQFVCPNGTVVSDPKLCPKDKAEITNTSLACGKPYTLVGAVCCRDVDSNGICDIDETTSSTAAMTTTTVLHTTTTFLETTTIPLATTTSTLGNISCYNSSDCGVNGKRVVKYYTCQPNLDGRVYRRYIEFICRHPGTSASMCVGSEKTEVLKVCGSGGCMEGTSVCKATGGLWLWRGNKTCNVTSCPGFLTLNNTKDAAAYYDPNRYDIKLNYITSSPIGANISVQRAGKESTDVFLTTEKKAVDNLEIELSAILMDSHPLVRIYVAPKNLTATTTTTRVPITFPPIAGDNVPEGAQELRNITKDQYAASYMGYSFKINEVIRIDHDPSSVKIDVLKPGGMVVTVEISSEFQEKIDDLIIGAFTDYRTLELVIWVYKPL